jgi:ATP-dependent Clp protease ATP-binding subunit ClpX
LAQDSEHEKAENISKSVQPKDLVKFDPIPEFIGRLPPISMLDELTESDQCHMPLDTKNTTKTIQSY